MLTTIGGSGEVARARPRSPASVLTVTSGSGSPSISGAVGIARRRTMPTRRVTSSSDVPRRRRSRSRRGLAVSGQDQSGRDRTGRGRTRAIPGRLPACRGTGPSGPGVARRGSHPTGGPSGATLGVAPEREIGSGAVRPRGSERGGEEVRRERHLVHDQLRSSGVSVVGLVAVCGARSRPFRISCPPHTPQGSSRSRAPSRHSTASGHLAQMALARAMSISSSLKKRWVRVPWPSRQRAFAHGSTIIGGNSARSVVGSTRSCALDGGHLGPSLVCAGGWLLLGDLDAVGAVEVRRRKTRKAAGIGSRRPVVCFSRSWSYVRRLPSRRVCRLVTFRSSMKDAMPEVAEPSHTYPS